MRKLVGWLALATVLSSSLPDVTRVALRLDESERSIGSKENPQARLEFEQSQIRNPETGKIPKNIRQKELRFSQSHISRSVLLAQRSDGSQEEVWELAGPFNVGGRTRAVALDESDATENTIIAGGISGGIWKSANGGTSWMRTSDPENRNSITSLAQDTRAGKENIWYYGTGELLGNSPRGGGAPYRGDGIFKSIDSGESWSQLASTNDSEPSVFGSQFQYIWRIVTNENKADVDEILVAAYGAILKSEDGGTTWTVELGEELFDLLPETDLNQSAAPFFTEIAKNGSDHFYAALSHTTSSDEIYLNGGYYWSENGADWYDISPTSINQIKLSRTVISAQGNQAYFFSSKNDLTVLYKYDFIDVNPDGSPNGSWTDLSTNLPDFEEIGELSTQSGYNMTIKIDPANSNLVFLGGTNLYRSTDGFQTPDNIDWIGGYKEGSTASLYANHHPDQHDILFFESSPKKMLSANDGGLYVTQNSSASEVFWTPLNNGYVTSQFYTINIPKNDETDIILGGLQDNGSVMNLSDQENASWSSVLGGDGAFTASVPLGLFWYFSFQESQIYRLSFNEQLELTSFARIDPTGGATSTGGTYLFINPYVLDPNNSNVMFLAGGNAIWRNNNLVQIPSGSQEATDVNWDLIETTKKPEGTISALEVTNDSKYLYYGTSFGELFRVDNPADMGNEVTSDIWQMNLPSEAYVSSIAVNPENSAEILTVFSNYGIPSIFHSTDAGQSFSDVSGSLEEFPDGTGNGPSIRWAEVVPLIGGTRYFVGTSTGLYSTENLDGAATVWLKESADKIGKSVVKMMDYRPLDGAFVVATHGNGVFRTSIEGFKKISPSTPEGSKFKVANNYPNPFKESTRIEFEIPETQYLRVDIYDMFGKHVRNLFLGPQYAGKNVVSWDGKNQQGEYMKDGMYIYRIYYDGLITGGRMVFER